MEFTELVDIKNLKELGESFSAFTRIGSAISDTAGNILVSAGWQDICAKFHRVNHVTASRCHESDMSLSMDVSKGKNYSIYRCKNGLIDVVFPVVIENEHLANFFIGQFLFEKPDRLFFTRQAEEFNFARESYLEALDSVPILSETYIMKIVDFLSRLVRIIGESGLVKRRVEEAREQLVLDLNNSTRQIKILSGLLPICTSCKKIRNNEGEWEEIEEYVHAHTEADFSHGMCPSCTKKLYPESAGK